MENHNKNQILSTFVNKTDKDIISVSEYPETSALYCFYKDAEILYIGSTKNLKTRINLHITNGVLSKLPSARLAYTLMKLEHAQKEEEKLNLLLFGNPRYNPQSYNKYQPLPRERSIVRRDKLPKSDKYIPVVVLRQIYETIDNPLEKAYFMFHAETGLRVSDIVGQKKPSSNARELGLEINNIDWQNLQAHVYDHKKNQWRWVVFPEKVKAALKLYLLYRQAQNIQDRQLFPISEKTANRIVKKWCAKVGFQYSKQVGSHWLRHTFIRLSRAAGRDIKLVQANTGDTIKTLLEWYADLSLEDKRREIENKPIT